MLSQEEFEALRNEARYTEFVMLVTESMTRTLWDSYGDNIGYIIDEELR
jgi:hypothetical protein